MSVLVFPFSVSQNWGTTKVKFVKLELDLVPYIISKFQSNGSQEYDNCFQIVSLVDMVKLLFGFCRLSLLNTPWSTVHLL
jgi:hypothetical protein